MRRFDIESDESGTPTKMTWRGDVPDAKTKAEHEREKLAEHERMLGKLKEGE